MGNNRNLAQLSLDLILGNRSDLATRAPLKETGAGVSCLYLDEFWPSSAVLAVAFQVYAGAFRMRACIRTRNALVRNETLRGCRNDREDRGESVRWRRSQVGSRKENWLGTTRAFSRMADFYILNMILSRTLVAGMKKLENPRRAPFLGPP